MDKVVLDSIKKVYLGIVVYDIIGMLVLFIIKKMSFSTAMGLIAGSVVAMLTFFMLAKSIISYVEKDKKRAMLSNMFGYVSRLAIYAAILLYAAITKQINVFTVAAGLISTSIVIKFQNLVLTKFNRKEI